MGAVQYDHQDESVKRLNPSTVGLHDYDHALCLPVVYRITLLMGYIITVEKPGFTRDTICIVKQKNMATSILYSFIRRLLVMNIQLSVCKT